MRLLLDTHSFLWFILADRRLSQNAEKLVAQPENIIQVSPASYWEIAIKISLGKYSLPEPYGFFWNENWRQTTFKSFQLSLGTLPC